MNWTSETTRFLRSNNPKPEKLPPIELTEEEKKKVIKEFKEVMEREPDEEEKEELFIVERKIKKERQEATGRLE